MQQSPIICVNASKSIERWERREGAPIFLERGERRDDYFSLWRRIGCAIAKTTHESLSFTFHRAVTRAYRLFFSMPLFSHEVNRSLSHNLRFRNSRFVKNIRSTRILSKFTLDTYYGVCVCVENTRERRERVCGVFVENDPKRIFDIALSFSL